MRQPVPSRLLLCWSMLTVLCGCLGLPGFTRAAATAATFPTGPGSLTGVWQNAEYKFTGLPPRERAVRASDGTSAPLTAAAAALLEKRLAEAEKGNVFANTLAQCLPGGIPQMLFGATYPIQIYESADQVTMLFEEQNHFRVIFLNGGHSDDPDPSYMGHSVGRWEADTFVVDTVALTDKTTLDMVGTPHTEALHVIERYRRTAKDRIEVRVWLEDRGAFSRPWEARTTWRAAPAGTRLSEYICENNRNAPDEHGFTGFRNDGGK